MTSYTTSVDGHQVDKKAFNWHMSARPALTANVTAAGSSGFTLAKVGDIPAGAIVIEDATTAGRVNISAGAASETLLGVAIHTRQGNDTRPLSYTILGVVEMIAGTGNITKGDLLAPDAVSGYYGCAIAWTPDVDGSNADGLIAMKACFGKALTSATAGSRFWAYVNFMK